MNKNMELKIAILDRADKLKITKDRISHAMDLDVAIECFNIDLERWLKADDTNFIHDFLGIYDNIDRTKVQTHMLKGEKITPELCESENIFNFFYPRFSR